LGETLGFALRLTEENKAEVTEKEEERMRSKIGVMFLTSAIALAMVGGSYAMWFEDLVMVGTVHTGTFDLDWSIDFLYDNEIVDKDFSYIDAWMIDDSTMQIYIHNAYPCITYTIEFDIYNAGTMAAHFAPMEISSAELLDDITITSITGDPLCDDPNTPGVYDGYQLHPGLDWLGKLQVHFTNDDNLLENTDYTFTITVKGYQYNEPCEEQAILKGVIIPEGEVTAGFVYPVPNSYWTVNVKTLPAGGPFSPPLNGILPIACVGWCVDEVGKIYGDNRDYTVSMMSSYDPMNPWPGNHVPATYDWPCVNWIINNKGEYTATEIQDAIWYFVDGGVNPGGNAGVLIAAALANGQNFVPESGDNVAVLLIPDPNVQYSLTVQHTFIEVDP
jgi:hypothetical protein